MGFAGTCECGRPADSFAGLCDRCVALRALELHMNASAAEIENSYRTLVKVWHPDRFQSDQKLRLAAEEKLKEINAAHEFLLSQPAAQELPRSAARPKPPEPQDFRAEAFVDPDPVDPEPEGAELDELRGILRRQRWGKMRLPSFLMKVGFVIGTLAAVALLWLLVDSILSANPRTAGAWEQYKAEISRDIQSSGIRLWSNATDDLHSQKSENPPPAAAPPPPEPVPANPPANVAPAGPRPAAGPPHIKVSGSGQGATPYVTSGLTPMEVLAILGNPSSSSGERMFYKGSEIDFRNGHVVGWKIDPGTAPIRVKLWPEAAPAPGLTNFAIGSSKSDVISLQGTPTLFSDNKFGYGNSVVLFQNDRVVGWKEDPASVRLRVAH